MPAIQVNLVFFHHVGDKCGNCGGNDNDKYVAKIQWMEIKVVF